MNRLSKIIRKSIFLPLKFPFFNDESFPDSSNRFTIIQELEFETENLIGKSKYEITELIGCFQDEGVNSTFPKKYLETINRFEAEITSIRVQILNRIKEDFENPQIESILISILSHNYLLLKSLTLWKDKSNEYLISEIYTLCDKKYWKTYLSAMLKLNFPYKRVCEQVLYDLYKEAKKNGYLNRYYLDALFIMANKFYGEDVSMLISILKLENFKNDDDRIYYIAAIYKVRDLVIPNELMSQLPKLQPSDPFHMLLKISMIEEITLEEAICIEEFLEKEEKLDFNFLLKFGKVLPLLNNWKICLFDKTYNRITHEIPSLNLGELIELNLSVKKFPFKYGFKIRMEILSKIFGNPKILSFECSKIFEYLLNFISKLDNQFQLSEDKIIIIDFFSTFFLKIGSFHVSKAKKFIKNITTFELKILYLSLGYKPLEKFEKINDDMIMFSLVNIIQNKKFKMVLDILMKFQFNRYSSIDPEALVELIFDNLTTLKQSDLIYHENMLDAFMDIPFNRLTSSSCYKLLTIISKFIEILEINYGAPKVIPMISSFIRNNLTCLKKNFSHKNIKLYTKYCKSEGNFYLPSEMINGTDSIIISEEIYFELEKLKVNIKNFKPKSQIMDKIKDLLEQYEIGNTKLLLGSLDTPEIRIFLLKYFYTKNHDGFKSFETRILSHLFLRIDPNCNTEYTLAQDVSNIMIQKLEKFSVKDLLILNNCTTFKMTKAFLKILKEILDRIDSKSINHFDSYEILIGLNCEILRINRISFLLKNVENYIQLFNSFEISQIFMRIFNKTPHMKMAKFITDNLESFLDEKRNCPFLILMALTKTNYGKLFLLRKMKKINFDTNLPEIFYNPKVALALLWIPEFYNKFSKFAPKTLDKKNFDNTSIYHALFLSFYSISEKVEIIQYIQMNIDMKTQSIESQTIISDIFLFAVENFPNSVLTNFLENMKLNIELLKIPIFKFQKFLLDIDIVENESKIHQKKVFSELKNDVDKFKCSVQFFIFKGKNSSEKNIQEFSKIMLKFLKLKNWKFSLNFCEQLIDYWVMHKEISDNSLKVRIYEIVEYNLKFVTFRDEYFYTIAFKLVKEIGISEYLFQLIRSLNN